jgi:predicted transcriptional regulator
MAVDKKKGTIAYIKDKMTVPEDIKEKSKTYVKIKKQIETSLKSGPKTIPQITEEINLPISTVTYYVMSLQKFGLLEANDVDDDDYYFYSLPGN